MARLTKRRKLFYPKNEQTLGLYTQGKEWMLVDGDKEYKGPYHKFSDGVVMTGATPTKLARYLTEYKDISKVDIKATEIYRSLNIIEKVDKYVAPQYYYPIVRPADIANGYIERYFVQKKNDQTVSTIIEIDKKQYENVRLKNGANINGKLYQKFLIRWVILGSEKEVKDTNRSTLSTFERQYKGIKRYLGVLTELSKYSPITSE